jgi:hypothetical protein
MENFEIYYKKLENNFLKFKKKLSNFLGEFFEEF